MPNEFARDAVGVLAYLLPGFLAAWVFYGLTSHPKPSQFERIVQALIFTFLIQALVPTARWTLELAGRHAALRPWDHSAEALTTVVLATLLGTILAYCANREFLRKKWLEARGLTARNPSTWYGVFSPRATFVILHLNDGRRLYGWPKEWPTEPGKGHFYIMLPSWIKEDGSQIELSSLDGILMSAGDVKWVEFLNQPQEC